MSIDWNILVGNEIKVVGSGKKNDYAIINHGSFQPYRSSNFQLTFTQ